MTATAPAPTAADLMSRLRAHRVRDEAELLGITGEPTERVRTKATPYLTPLMEEFIAACPFFVVGTAGAEGTCDASPKGDLPGAVRVLDRRTLAIPDRIGNRRVDGHRNILTNPNIALLFIVPAVDETLRINGRAFLTTDPELLETMPVQGKTPKLATIVEVDEAYMHCARAFLRSGLWRPETWPNPDTIPTLGAIACEQRDMPPPDETAGKRQEEYRSILY